MMLTRNNLQNIMTILLNLPCRHSFAYHITMAVPVSTEENSVSCVVVSRNPKVSVEVHTNKQTHPLTHPMKQTQKSPTSCIPL